MTAAEAMVVAVESAARAASLYGTVMVNRRDARGFCLWACANCVWIASAASAHQWRQMALFVAYLALSAHGLWKWTRKKQRPRCRRTPIK